MKVVCLILGPMLAYQPCSHAFWALTSLHLLSFLLKMFFIILVYTFVACCFYKFQKGIEVIYLYYCTKEVLYSPKLLRAINFPFS